MAPPGAATEQGEPKDIFKYDAQGRRAELIVRQPSGEIIYRMAYEYDDQGRLSESSRLEGDGTVTSRVVYGYDGNSRFPAKSVEYGSGNKERRKVTYSEYKLNTQGDWVQRMETTKERGGADKVAMIYRTIEY